MVRILAGAQEARASRAVSASSSSTRSTQSDAPQTLGQGADGSTPLRLDDPRTSSIGRGARNRRAISCSRRRTSREKLFDARQTSQVGINGYQMNMMRLFGFMFPGGWAGGGLALDRSSW